MKEFCFSTIAALMVALSPTLGLAQQPGGYGSTAAPQAAPHAAIICTGHSAWGESRIELERLIPGATDGSAIYVRTSGGDHGRYKGTYGVDGVLTFPGPTGNYKVEVYPDRLVGSFRTTEADDGAYAENFTWACAGSTAGVLQASSTPVAAQGR